MKSTSRGCENVEGFPLENYGTPPPTPSSPKQELPLHLPYISTVGRVLRSDGRPVSQGILDRLITRLDSLFPLRNIEL